MQKGCIYKVTNTLNGKIYIGKTVQKPERRWYFHKYCAKNGNSGALYNAIRKYGEVAFKFEVVQEDIAQSVLCDLERKYISDFNSCALDGSAHGYNLTRGGDGGSSEASLAMQNKKVLLGIHQFQGIAGRELQLKRISNGTHNFTPENRREYQRRAVRDKEAISLSTSKSMLERSSKGIHQWQGGEHTARIIANGTHSSCKQHICPHCGKIGNGGGMSRWHFNNCKQKGE